MSRVALGKPAHLFALMDLMKRSALRSCSFNSSSTTTPRTRCSGGNPTCALFQSAEVQSFVQSSAPPPSFTILTVGCDPANVIQMSCITWGRRLSQRTAAIIVQRERPLYEDGGYGNNGFSDGGCQNKEPLLGFLWDFFPPNPSSKFCCRSTREEEAL